MTNDTGRIVFLDTETTSLNRLTRRVWEAALIVRDPGADDIEMSWTVWDIDLAEADPMSLRIGRFYDRHPRFSQGSALSTPSAPKAMIQNEKELAHLIEWWTRGATLVGAVPSFDEETLAALLRRYGLCPSWHFHLVDVETLAAGALRRPPRWNFDILLNAYGLTYDEADRHTALGDTRMVRDLYDAVMNSPK